MSAVLKCVQQAKPVIPVFHTISRFDRQLSHNTALVTKVHRETYVRSYPTTLVLPNGSSYTIRYHEPRPVVQLPCDLSTLSPEEINVRLERRKPKQKVVIAKEQKDNFKASKYINLIRKKK